MKKAMALMALAVMCSLGSHCLAADLDNKELKDFKLLPTQFASQTKCIQGIYLLRYSYSLVNGLADNGWSSLSEKSFKSVDELKTNFRLQVPAILVKYETNLLKYGWTQDSLLRHLGIISNIDMHYRLNDPTYAQNDFYKLFDYQKQRCYSYFKEFPEDDAYEQSIIEKIALPEHIGWSDFKVEVNGKMLKLDANGNPL